MIALRRKLPTGAFDTADKDFLEGIGHVAELALKNCLMFETQQFMRRGLESLVQATRVVSSASNAEQLCHAVVHVNLLHVERIDVWRPDSDGLAQVNSAPAVREETDAAPPAPRRRTLSRGLSLSKIQTQPAITYRNSVKWSDHSHPVICCANERERIRTDRKVYYAILLREDEGELQLQEPKLFGVIEFSLGPSAIEADDLMHLQAFADHVNEVVKSISLHNKMGEMHDSLQQMIATITSYVFVMAPNKTLNSVNHDLFDFGWDLELLYDTPYPIWLTSQNIQIVNDLDAAYSKSATRRKACPRARAHALSANRARTACDRACTLTHSHALARACALSPTVAAHTGWRRMRSGHRAGRVCTRRRRCRALPDLERELRAVAMRWARALFVKYSCKTLATLSRVLGVEF
jgi:hypothetical protein